MNEPVLVLRSLKGPVLHLEDLAMMNLHLSFVFKEVRPCPQTSAPFKMCPIDTTNLRKREENKRQKVRGNE